MARSMPLIMTGLYMTDCSVTRLTEIYVLVQYSYVPESMLQSTSQSRKLSITISLSTTLNVYKSM